VGPFRRILVGAALVIPLLGIALAAPVGGASAQTLTFSFTGTCQFTVTAANTTPTTELGFGTCTGTLTGYISLDLYGTTNVSVPSVFAVDDSQGAWLPPLAALGLPREPLLAAGQGEIGLEVPCGGGGYCANGILFSLTQVSPLAFTGIGSTGGLGVGLTVPAGAGSTSVSLVSLDMSS
jgi:hypothetical protein